METHKLVLPEHLNHYGYLFGGYMLKWVDEIAYIAASLDYPKFNFVTIAMDQVVFRQTVTEGAILSFTTERVRIGNTSLSYRVDVNLTRCEDAAQHGSIFSTTVSLVRVDEHGNKAPIGVG